MREIEPDDLPPVDSLPRNISFVTCKRATGEIPFTVDTPTGGRKRNFLRFGRRP